MHITSSQLGHFFEHAIHRSSPQSTHKLYISLQYILHFALSHELHLLSLEQQFSHIINAQDL
jgi:hypothetical protein